MVKVVRIGCGNGGSLDRVADAFDMVAKDNVRYLCMDSLAERSLTLLQMRMLERMGPGFDDRVPAYAEQPLLSVAQDFSVRGIRGNATLPGVIEGPLLDDGLADPVMRETTSVPHSIGRYGKPIEVTEAVAWLLSDASSLETGGSHAS